MGMKNSTLPVLLLVLLSGCSTQQPALVSEAETMQRPTGPAVDAVSLESSTPETTSTAEGEVAVRLAVQRALPFIEEQGTAWMEGRVSIQEGAACVSCHHVNYALWSHAEARRVGIDDLAPKFETLRSTAVDFLGKPSVPRTLSVGPLLLAEPRHAKTLQASLTDLQTADGDWPAQGQFPSQRRPVPESDAIATIYALLALRQVSLDDLTATAVPSPDDVVHHKAVSWLAQQPDGESTEWAAWRLVLAHATGDETSVAGLQQRLLDGQGDDGGWGWLANEPSEAFSTGQALYALSLLRGSPLDDGSTGSAVQAAQEYLIQSQTGDGSWITPSEVISAEPDDRKDVIYHFWGTAWASLGLSRSLDPEPESAQQAGRQALTPRPPLPQAGEGESEEGPAVVARVASSERPTPRS